MTTAMIIVISLTLAGILFMIGWVIFKGMKIQWPKSKKVEKQTDRGVSVYVFNSSKKYKKPYEHDIIANVCVNAISCCFDAWRVRESVKNKDMPNPEEVFSAIGVEFVNDTVYEYYGDYAAPETTIIYGYLTEATSSFPPSAPLIVVDSRLEEKHAAHVVIHETVHALIMNCTKYIGGDFLHESKYWEVEKLAVSMYNNKYTLSL